MILRSRTSPDPACMLSSEVCRQHMHCELFLGRQRGRTMASMHPGPKIIQAAANNMLYSAEFSSRAMHCEVLQLPDRCSLVHALGDAEMQE